MRQEFRSGKIPEHLTINDVKNGPFFASEDRKYFEQITENLIQEQLKIKKDDVPPVPSFKGPVAEMQACFYNSEACCIKIFCLFERQPLH